MALLCVSSKNAHYRASWGGHSYVKLRQLTSFAGCLRILPPMGGIV